MPLLLIGTSATGLSAYAAFLGVRAGPAHLLIWPYLAVLAAISLAGALAIFFFGEERADLEPGQRIGDGLIVVPVREWESLRARPSAPAPGRSRAATPPASASARASWDEGAPSAPLAPVARPRPAPSLSAPRPSAPRAERAPAAAARPPAPEPTPAPVAPTVMAFAPGISGLGGDVAQSRGARGDRSGAREAPAPMPLPKVERPAPAPASPPSTPSGSSDPGASTRAAAEELEATLRSYGITLPREPAATSAAAPAPHRPGARCPGCRQLLGESDEEVCDSCGLPMCATCDRATTAAGHEGLCRICMALLREAA
jgi:hypothetical protein